MCCVIILCVCVVCCVNLLLYDILWHLLEHAGWENVGPLCRDSGQTHPHDERECSLNVHWMFTECALDVHWMFTECGMDRLEKCGSPMKRLRTNSPPWWALPRSTTPTSSAFSWWTRYIKGSGGGQEGSGGGGLDVVAIMHVSSLLNQELQQWVAHTSMYVWYVLGTSRLSSWIPITRPRILINCL